MFFVPQKYEKIVELLNYYLFLYYSLYHSYRPCSSLLHIWYQFFAFFALFKVIYLPTNADVVIVVALSQSFLSTFRFVLYARERATTTAFVIVGRAINIWKAISKRSHKLTSKTNFGAPIIFSWLYFKLRAIVLQYPYLLQRLRGSLTWFILYKIFIFIPNLVQHRSAIVFTVLKILDGILKTLKIYIFTQCRTKCNMSK